jgi:hypothetical protein
MSPGQRLALSPESPPVHDGPRLAEGPPAGEDWGAYTVQGVTTNVCQRCGAPLLRTSSATVGYHVPGTREGSPSICAACHGETR